MLLKWPCNLEGNVTLRNVENLEQVNELIRMLWKNYIVFLGTFDNFRQNFTLFFN